MKTQLKRILTLLFGGVVASSTFANPQLDQIKQNSKFVVAQFGPTSGIANFGCNNESIAYLDGFISRQVATIKKDAQAEDRFISLFGAFLGECILSSYGSTWVQSKNGIHIEIASKGKVNIAQPFHKVAKRVQFGASESLVSYFRDTLPAALESLAVK